MIRYKQLADIIIENKCTSILEIGTHKGANAKNMIKAAAVASPGKTISYYGIDLFELYKEDIGKEEFNGKGAPPHCDRVYEDLTSFCISNKIDAHIFLYAGKSEDIIKTIGNGSEFWCDIIFVDGGHSLKTIATDLDFALDHAKIVVADDYYCNREDYGCASYVKSSRAPWFVMPFMDKMGGNDISMAVSPTTAYPWTRYIPIYTFLKESKPKTVALFPNPYMSVLESNIKLLAPVFGFDFVADPVSCEDLDLAILQLDELSVEEAKVIYDLVKHAKAIFIDGIEGDTSSGYKGIGLDLLENDGRSPVLPMSADGMTIAMWPAGDSPVTLQVKTRNCVEAEYINENISTNTPKIEKWCMPCKPCDKTAILVSAGSSLKKPETLVALKKHAEDKNCVIFCVKHSHNYLIDNGIIPFGCILLDPRDHVQYFIDDPHPDVKYFVASMCHPTTVSLLLDQGADVIGYNARVSNSIDTFLEYNERDMCITVPGGSSAATRGISLLHLLGFRKFLCYAFDLTYTDKPKKASEKTPQGFNKDVEVEYAGRKFWTNLELIAQVDDIKAIYQTIDRCRLNDWSGVDVKFVGDNLGQYAASKVVRFDYKFTLDDVLRGIDARKLPAPSEQEHSFKVLS